MGSREDGRSAAGGLVVSVVSHGHGACLDALLHDLARFSAASVSRVVLTLNVPEPLPAPPEQGWPFAFEVLRNCRPRGFGANHNRALQGAPEAVVCVLNPDVRLLPGDDPFMALVGALAGPGAGCAYPRQVDGLGRLQDSERSLPTPWALWRRRVLRRASEGAGTDWVNAACVVLPATVWRTLGGFDERYFMYCEDVDLCLRLRRAGWRLVGAPVAVVHAGARASRRRLRHLYWHVSSLVRLWRSPVYRWARNHPATGI